MKKNRIHLRNLVFWAMLVVIEIVLNRFLSFNTMGLKIGFSFVPIVVAAVLFGPSAAALTYGLADFLGAILFPIGPYHPGFTVCAALMGAVWGIFLNKIVNTNRKSRFYLGLGIVTASLINNLILGLLVNSLWVSMLYGSKTYVGWLIYRLPEYAVLIPLNIVVIPFILKLCDKLKKITSNAG